MARASREMSVAVVLACASSCARLTAMLPQPGATDGDVAAAGADVGDLGRLEREAVQNLERFLDDELRLGPRDEDGRCHGEVDTPELAHADDVRGRLAGDAAGDPLGERRLER